eukprot:GILK01008117.1.p1 GENE.GILK01008117.1~~GILK01008117.1.p1  ORF type:complete len:512 (+),score=36.89 GILK01008117.1:65-1537(+)
MPVTRSSSRRRQEDGDGTRESTSSESTYEIIDVAAGAVADNPARGRKRSAARSRTPSRSRNAVAPSEEAPSTPPILNDSINPTSVVAQDRVPARVSRSSTPSRRVLKLVREDGTPVPLRFDTDTSVEDVKQCIRQVLCQTLKEDPPTETYLQRGGDNQPVSSEALHETGTFVLRETPAEAGNDKLVDHIVAFSLPFVATLLPSLVLFQIPAILFNVSPLSSVTLIRSFFSFPVPECFLLFLVFGLWTLCRVTRLYFEREWLHPLWTTWLQRRIRSIWPGCPDGWNRLVFFYQPDLRTLTTSSALPSVFEHDIAVRRGRTRRLLSILYPQQENVVILKRLLRSVSTVAEDWINPDFLLSDMDESVVLSQSFFDCGVSDHLYVLHRPGTRPYFGFYSSLTAEHQLRNLSFLPLIVTDITGRILAMAPSDSRLFGLLIISSCACSVFAPFWISLGRSVQLWVMAELYKARGLWLPLLNIIGVLAVIFAVTYAQ